MPPSSDRLPERAAAASLQRLLGAIERRGRGLVFLRSAARAFAALAPCAALVSLLVALFGPALFDAATPLGVTPAVVSLGVAVGAALGAGIIAARRPTRGAWIPRADSILQLEGRLDAGAAILAGRATSRLAPLALADADWRATSLRARDALPVPRVGRALTVGAVAILLSLLASFVPPVRAAVPPTNDDATARSPFRNDPPSRATPPGPPSSDPPEASPLSDPPIRKPDESPPNPPPEPKPQPQGGESPKPLGPPPHAMNARLDPKFLEPLVGEGDLREKDAFTPEQGSAESRDAKPLEPEVLRRLFPEIQKRAEASLPRQAFTDEERRIVIEYMKWVPR